VEQVVVADSFWNRNMRKKQILGVDVMKLSKNHKINESILGRMPDFKIDEAVDLCVDRLAQYVKSYILQDVSKDPVQRNASIVNANLVLDELREELGEIVKEKLFMYSKG
jgi:hypothetical protein